MISTATLRKATVQNSPTRKMNFTVLLLLLAATASLVPTSCASNLLRKMSPHDGDLSAPNQLSSGNSPVTGEMEAIALSMRLDTSIQNFQQPHPQESLPVSTTSLTGYLMSEVHGNAACTKLHYVVATILNTCINEVIATGPYTKLNCNCDPEPTHNPFCGSIFSNFPEGTRRERELRTRTSMFKFEISNIHDRSIDRAPNNNAQCTMHSYPGEEFNKFWSNGLAAFSFLSTFILSNKSLKTCGSTTRHHALWMSLCSPHLFRPSHWTIELCSLHRFAIPCGLHDCIASRLLPALRRQPRNVK